MTISDNQYRPFGKTGLVVPPIQFGTMVLGNVQRVIPEQTKFAICGEWFRQVASPVFIETSRGYGAGAEIELVSRVFRRLDIASEEVVICAELGVPEERPDYDSNIRDWEESRRLLGSRYAPQLVSMHDPDDFLSSAKSPDEAASRFNEVLEAYRALCDLKATGKVAGIGIRTKNWRRAQEIDATVDLDWVTLLGCCTVMHHPSDVLEFMAKLTERGIAIVQTGVFQCDFLVGGTRFDGRVVNSEDSADRGHFAWRKAFVALCQGHGISPAHACIQFALSAPGVVAVAINSSQPDRVVQNCESVSTKVPPKFWDSLREEGLLDERYPYLG